PEWRLYKTVSIQGEVKYPGTYTIRKGERLSSLIERAGGYTDKAYLRGTVFTRKKVKETQQKSLEEMALRLERELLVSGTAQVSAAVTREEIEAEKVEFQQKQRFIETLKKLKATGRMTIKLAHPRLLRGSEYDIELQNGDTLSIPVHENEVNVIGAVMSQSSFIYSEKMDYEDYIETAGGFTRYADKDKVYVLKVDGSAKNLSSGFFNWSSSRSRWEMDAFGEKTKEIEPGDSIIVPEKLERIAWLRQIKDITQILYQIAVTAGVIIVAF
ncbi:MAG: SLBB domain-containing protein, partial [Thermodesulfovibrionia bacterium]|nr:SLBB domain-containing protein [Thermodesulfovibrionia bacterium]